MEHTIETPVYQRPEAECLPLQAASVLCISTGTEPFDDHGNYDWGA
ncbi:MAG: hypothetical protein IJ654_06875 [Bacteroidales bacterium]|nr:hypothetical protein [Bacteroidales bacterium]